MSRLSLAVIAALIAAPALAAAQAQSPMATAPMATAPMAKADPHAAMGKPCKTRDGKMGTKMAGHGCMAKLVADEKMMPDDKMKSDSPMASQPMATKH